MAGGDKGADAATAVAADVADVRSRGSLYLWNKPGSFPAPQ